MEACRTCNDIMMSEFIPILLGKNNPLDAEDLRAEFSSLVESKRSSYVLDLMKSISSLKVKYFIVFKCVEVLSNVYSRDLANELKLVGCKGKFDPADELGYSRDLKAALSYNKRLLTQIAAKEKEFDRLQEKQEEITAQDFNDQAIQLGKTVGYRVDLKTTSAAEWASLVNYHNRACEVANAGNGNKVKPSGYGNAEN